jgi:hypothetical protein
MLLDRAAGLAAVSTTLTRDASLSGEIGRLASRLAGSHRGGRTEHGTDSTIGH